MQAQVQAKQWKGLCDQRVLEYVSLKKKKKPTKLAEVLDQLSTLTFRIASRTTIDYINESQELGSTVPGTKFDLSGADQALWQADSEEKTIE